MFYSSSEFSHLAADKTKKLLYTKKKKQTELQQFLIYFLREETLNDLYQKEGPDTISQAADERAPAAPSSGDTVIPRPDALTLSHPLQGHKDPMVLCPPSCERGGQPACSPSSAQAAATSPMHWGGAGSSKAQGDRESRLGTVEWPYKNNCSNCAKSQQFLGLTIVRFLTKEAVLYRKRGQD